jgi:hypothetical protein
LLVGEPELMVADRYDITVLKGMFLDQLAVDVCAVGAIQVLEKRIVEDIDNQGVMAADRRVVYTNIVVWKAPNRVSLFRHVVFSQSLTVQTEN